MKTCTKCKTTKPHLAFYADKRRNDGLRSWCKDCHNEGSNSWQAKNRERDLENKRNYMSNWRMSLSEEEREIQRRLNREWYRDHPEWAAAKRARRSALKINAASDSQLDLTAYASILRKDPCSYCGNPADSIDHIEPLYHGGSNTCENLTGACGLCNSKKRTKSLLQFLLEAR